MITRKRIMSAIMVVVILLIVARTLDVASMASLDMRLAEVRRRGAAIMTGALAQTSQPTAAQPTAVPPTQTPSLQRTLYRVVEAFSGDTIKVSRAGKTYLICYAGIDAPDPATGIGSRAIQANRRFVKAKTVYLERDSSEADQGGCLVRHVFLEDGTFVGAKLVYFGYAVVRADYPNTRYRDALLKMQQEAKEAKFGLWNPGPVPSSLPAPAAVPAAVLAPSGAPQPPTTAKPVPPTQPPPTSTPTTEIIPEPSPTPALTIEVVSLTSPISRGSNATLTIKTTPGAHCNITVHYKSGPSEAEGLESRIADGEGRVSWTWKVGTRTTPGMWSIVVRASAEGQITSKEIPFVVE